MLVKFFSKSRQWKQHYRFNSFLHLCKGFHRYPGLIQLCTMIFMLLPLQNPLQRAWDAESAVVPCHKTSWLLPAGQEPCAHAVISCCNKPISWHKSRQSRFHASHHSWRSPINSGSLKVYGRQLEILALRTWKEFYASQISLSSAGSRTYWKY